MRIDEIIYKDIDDVDIKEYEGAFSFLARKNLPLNASMADIQNAKSKYLIAYDSYRLVISILMAILSVILNFVISLIYDMDLEHKMEDSTLLKIWPWNNNAFDQFRRSGLFQTEAGLKNFYWLSYLCSVTTLIWLVWILWRIWIEIHRHDRMNVSRQEYFSALKAVAVLMAGIMVCFLASISDLSTSHSFYGPSLADAPAVYAAKKVALISSFFGLVGILMFVVSMILRYKRKA
ncbi:hypothetical protein [Mesorhizobium sp. ES1-1]|uniref:hypothetical protein n=1 Tax=Mesorhizobium sp. ES1-1 TaxID=2876629 RepID=UPI001CCD6089|nr:hypothetical protein [Mesorhizobium sp. ES1-1]MBZ9678257.1 hypothetical protein [Mesorhizobium sp. ES1-1]